MSEDRSAAEDRSATKQSEDRSAAEDRRANQQSEERIEGAAVVRAAVAGTVVFAVTSVAAVAFPGWPEAVAFAVAVCLFVLGAVAFVWAYLGAVRRSRSEVVGIAGVYFLAGGSARRSVRTRLLGALTVQVGVALATAAARPYTSLAAGTLVPLYGLGLCGLWSSRHGQFPGRHDEPRPTSRRSMTR
jgi:cation transport ATPase